MSHYMDFDPGMIRSRNEQMRRDFHSLRLEEQLRKDRSPRGVQLLVLAERATLRCVMKRLRWGGTTAMVLAFAVILTVLVASSSQARGKPDLVVTSAQLTSENYVVLGEESTYSFKDTTKNQGTSSAGPSQTALVLNETSASPTRGVLDGMPAAEREVPKLKRDHSDKGSRSDTYPLSNPIFIGTYYAFVCADRLQTVAESREGNNCKDTGERLSIIPKTWTGNVNGSASVVPGVTETWTAQDMTFTFDSYTPPYFEYKANGDLAYSISGTDGDGCEWSGSGTATIVNKGTLSVHDQFGTYEGWAVIMDPVYTITISCPSGSETQIDGPWSSVWFHTGAPSPTISDPFGVDSLAGSYTTSLTPDGRSLHWDWDLAAA